MTILLAQENSRALLAASLNDRSIYTSTGATTVNTQKALAQARVAMLMFASLQGYSNSGEWGRLPCPDRTGDGIADSACNTVTTWFGYVPTRQRIIKNQWISGLNLDATALQHLQSIKPQSNALMYAVAPRVTSGEPVQWNTPTPTTGLIRLKNAQGVTISDQAVAVLAINPIISTSSYEIQASEPIIWISYAELAAIMQLKARSLFGENARNYFRSDAARQAVLTPSTLPPTLSSNGLQTTPVISACNCVCTKIRCKCGCAVSAQWISPSNCTTGTTGSCTPQSAAYVCTANAGQVCVFGGAAGLVSRWPVTKWSPQPVASSSCVAASTSNVSSDSCPLSSNSSSCTCDFDWSVALQGYALTTLSGYRMTSDLWAIADSPAWTNPVNTNLLAQSTNNRPIPRRPVSPTYDLNSLFTVIRPPL